MKIFVYGSLLSGLHNHPIMQGAKGRPPATFLGCAVSVDRFTMRSIGDYFPAIEPNGETAIIGEIYDCPAGLVRYLDCFEGPGYDRLPIKTTAGDCFAYVAKPATVRTSYGRPAVASGNWREYRETCAAK